jgi:hypothetical protein
VDYIPLFQFLAFYQNDLEILPGVNMNLHGPVHTNGALYLNANSTMTVSELDPDIPSVHLSAAGSIYRGRKETSSCTGTVTISKLDDANNDNVLDPMNIACGSGTTALSSAALSGWLGALAANQPVVTVRRRTRSSSAPGSSGRRRTSVSRSTRRRPMGPGSCPSAC